MKHYRIFSFILLFICAAFGQSCSISSSGREVLDMNTDWAFYRGDVVEGSRTDLDDSGWIPVALPHIMQLEMKHCGGNSIYDGIGWYGRYFKLPAKYKDKRIVVSFEGVMTNCDVYLNGQKVTEHHGGYMGFVADLTNRIDWNGNNVLAVRVSAEPDPLTPPGKPQDKMDFYYYSGIYRDVRMVITDKVYITDPLEEDLVAGGGQFVTFPEVTKDKARAHLATHVRNLTDKDQTLSVFSQLVERWSRTSLLTSLLYGILIRLISILCVRNYYRKIKCSTKPPGKSVFVRSGTRPRKDSLSMVKNCICAEPTVTRLLPMLGMRLPTQCRYGM